MTPKKGWQERFLIALQQSPNVSDACRAAEISRKTAYQERAHSEEFAEAWEDAQEAALDALEAAVFKRATDTSDVLAMFLLKSHRPERYRETTRSEIAVTGFEGWTDQECEEYARTGQRPNPRTSPGPEGAGAPSS